MIPLPLKHQQQGVTLLTALMLLFIITLLTLSSVNSTLLDSKIASNLRDSDLSFQTAEITLKEAEKYIHNTVPLPVFNDSNGLLPYEPETTRDLANDIVWDSYSHADVSLPTILHVATSPEYVIEQLPPTGNNNGTLEAGLAQENAYYRVTARSEGATGSSIVVLQAVIKR
jgi:type IV pilus assembly protein PilX